MMVESGPLDFRTSVGLSTNSNAGGFDKGGMVDAKASYSLSCVCWLVREWSFWESPLLVGAERENIVVQLKSHTN